MWGTSDRLKMIPVILKLAYTSERLLFIHWSKPFPLEEFLRPNTNYVNWTLPDYLYEPLNVEAVAPIWALGKHLEYGMLDAKSQQQRVLRIVSVLYASHYYDTHPIRLNTTTSLSISGDINNNNNNGDELPMWDAYSDFWRALFAPSIGVRNEILATLRDLDLLSSVDGNDVQYIKPGPTNSTMASPSSSSTAAQSLALLMHVNVKPYVSVHVRANYTRDQSQHHLEVNAIRCATLLQQRYQENVSRYSDNKNISHNGSSHNSSNQLPIYIASDTSIVTQRAIQYGLDHGLRVVSRDPRLYPRNDANTTTITSSSTGSGTTTNPYHLDQPLPVTDDSALQPSDFYATFVDFVPISDGTVSHVGSGWIRELGGRDCTKSRKSPLSKYRTQQRSVLIKNCLTNLRFPLFAHN